MKKIMFNFFLQKFYSTDHKKNTSYVVKSVRDVIEGRKCMAIHTACECKNDFCDHPCIQMPVVFSKLL